MAKFTYPPDQERFKVTEGESAIMTVLAGGAPRIRRTQLGTWARVSCQWTLTPDGFTAVRAFIKTTLVEGSLPFTIDLYMQSGSLLTTHEAILVPGSYSLDGQSGLKFIFP